MQDYRDLRPAPRPTSKGTLCLMAAMVVVGGAVLMQATDSPALDDQAAAPPSGLPAPASTRLAASSRSDFVSAPSLTILQVP
jgi:hypothetical protein